jgi:hypothetical protein
MRKFPQPACFALGLCVLAGCFGALRNAAKDGGIRGLDSAFSWRIAEGEGRFVAVARVPRGGLTATSTNGSEWQVSRMLAGLIAVTHGAGKFVAVGESGAVAVTTNGVHWRITSITTNELCGVLFADGCFVASGCAPFREFFTSRDGFVWRRHGAGEGAEGSNDENFGCLGYRCQWRGGADTDLYRQRGEGALPCRDFRQIRGMCWAWGGCLPRPPS